MIVNINPAKIGIDFGNVTISGNVEVKPLTATENGEYSEQGVAYSPVNVAVPGIVPTGEINITANGDYDVTEKATAHVAVPMWWCGDEWEKLSNCWDETTTLKAVGFDGWTASTTAGTLRAGGTANTFSADMANYDYLIRWRFYWAAAYKSGATMLAIPASGATDLYQFLTRRPQNLAAVRSETFNQNTYALFYSVLYQEYYNTSGVHTANWGNTYGITVTAVAPTYSGGDNITVTPNYPSIGARCNGSYFATARKTDIDSENSQIRLVGEVYRIKRSALRQSYVDMVDVANNGL